MTLRSLLALAIAVLAAAPARTAAEPVRLPHHVLPPLATATRLDRPGRGDTSMTITFVLRRDDEAGFRRFLQRLEDPASRDHRHFLSQAELADRFGPSERTYDRLARQLAAHGLRPVERSANRLTLTVRGTRAQVERALDVH